MKMRTPLKLAIGSHIKAARESAGLTQEILSERIRINKNSLSAIETGVHKPSIETLIKLSKALHCSTDYLLMGRIAHEESHLELYYNLIRTLSDSDREIVLQVMQTLASSLQGKEEYGKSPEL